MSSPLDSIDPEALAAVTGGGTCANNNGNVDTLLNQLTSITSSLKDFNAKTSGLNSNEMMLLCMLAMQNRGPNVVYVGSRRGYWW